ncbi:purine permease, partial [Streptococcus danieliae]|nr:purine permease [Streptococcus danieliae]
MSHNTQKEEVAIMLYGVEDRPPKGLAILLALQHILAAFAGIIAVPLVVASALGLP